MKPTTPEPTKKGVEGLKDALKGKPAQAAEPELHQPGTPEYDKLSKEILSSDTFSMISDLAWPKRKIAISIDQIYTKKVKTIGWEVYSMLECLNFFSNETFHAIASKLR